MVAPYPIVHTNVRKATRQDLYYPMAGMPIHHVTVGIYDLASGTTTWFDYAQLVFAKAREAGVELTVTQLNAVPTSAFPTPAKRPHNSRLDTTKFQRTFNLRLPDWTVGVERMLTEILGK